MPPIGSLLVPEHARDGFSENLAGAIESVGAGCSRCIHGLLNWIKPDDMVSAAKNDPLHARHMSCSEDIISCNEICRSNLFDRSFTRDSGHVDDRVNPGDYGSCCDWIRKVTADRLLAVFGRIQSEDVGAAQPDTRA
jgi:hypothetical protein